MSSLRRLAGPLGSTAGAAAGAALQEGRCLVGGSGSGGDAALRALASGLRQLHAAASATRLQAEASSRAPARLKQLVEAEAGGGVSAVGGTQRGYSAQPAEAPKAWQQGSGEGASSAASSSGVAPPSTPSPTRPKPRFLLERLGLGRQQQQQQAQQQAPNPGAGGGQRPHGNWPQQQQPQAGWGNAAGGAQQQRGPLQQPGQQQRSSPQHGGQQQGRPSYEGQQQGGQQGRPPYGGQQGQQQGRPQNGAQQQGRPQYGGQQGQQQGRPQYGAPQGQQQGRPQYGGQQGQQQGRPQQQQPGRPGQQQQQQQPWGQQQRTQPQQQGGRPPQGGAPNGFPRRPPQQQGGGAPAGAAQHQQQVRAPYQTSFMEGLPTAFPTAFPRMQQPSGGGGGRSGGGNSGNAASSSKQRRAVQQAQRVAAQVSAAEVPDEVFIPEDVTVLRLAQLLDVPIHKVEAVLQELDEQCSSRQDSVPPDAAELVALEFGKVAVLGNRNGRNAPLDADAVPRPAVVTVMGHVDHGKTTLLDALRSTSVAAGEAGGITQHIGAFEVQMPGSRQSLTFLDTPGHAAFSSMRARGAAVTDLVVLVVAADDGMMPQTREAISHSRAAGCPIVVAITKCDMPSAQPERVRKQLMAAGLELEEMGGNIQVVEVAATTGQGLGELEESLLLQADLMELQASRSRRAEAVVIEAKVDKGQGPVATVVVKRGTLKVGQPMVVGTEWGRVRSLRGTGGKTITEVLPGQPAEIAGLKGLPQAGDQLLVVDSEERAQVISRARTSNAEYHRRAAISRMQTAAQQQLAGGGGGGGEQGPDGEPLQRTLPIIIKADVQGSAEAVRDAVAHMSTEHVRVQVVHVGVGPVSHSDVQLAVPLKARILGFNVRTAGADVEAEAKQHGVEVRCQRVIYGLLEDVGSLLVGASPKVEHEVVAGTAEVLQVFQLKGNRGKEAGVVAGCRVSEGSIKASMRYRVMRDGEAVHTGGCSSLKRHKLEVETVGKGTECGVLLAGFDDLKPGDVLQCITVEMRASTQVSAGEQKRW